MVGLHKYDNLQIGIEIVIFIRTFSIDLPNYMNVVLNIKRDEEYCFVLLNQNYLSMQFRL